MSCLFNSLSYFVNVNEDGKNLRNIICDYLEEDNIIFDDMNVSKIVEPETTCDYVTNMRCENTFGGALEIKAFCRLFKLNVLVKSFPNNRNIEFVENKNTNNWVIISWTGNHFEPLGRCIGDPGNLPPICIPPIA